MDPFEFFAVYGHTIIAFGTVDGATALHANLARFTRADLVAIIVGFSEATKITEKSIFEAGQDAGAAEIVLQVAEALDKKGLKPEDIFDPCGDSNCPCASPAEDPAELSIEDRNAAARMGVSLPMDGILDSADTPGYRCSDPNCFCQAL